MKVLAFDFGASGGRGIVFELRDGKIESREVHRFDNDPVQVARPDGTVEFHWDVLRLLFEIKAGITKCKNEGIDIGAIGIDTWGVDYGLLDKNGSLIGNPYHYRDTRTNRITFTEEKKKEIFYRTGIQHAPINTLYQFLCDKDVPATACAETALFMPDLLNYFLTGVQKTEYTIASTSQMLDARARAFDTEMLSELGLRDLFPPIVMPGTIIGTLSDAICEELMVDRIPVVAVTSHDTAAAVVCTPMEDAKRSLYVSCGTWLLLGAETDEPVIDEKSMTYNYTNEGGAFGKYRLLHNIMGLWIQQESRRAWRRAGLEVSYQQMEDEAVLAEPLTCLINPNDPVFSPPGNMPKRIQDFAARTGQTVPEGVGAITRCIMESLALECARAVREMEDMLPDSIETIHMVGGGIKNAILCQYVANASGKRVVAGPIEATSTGNALMQLYALGEIKSLAEARAIVKASTSLKTYEPQDAAVWAEANARFKKICAM